MGYATLQTGQNYTPFDTAAEPPRRVLLYSGSFNHIVDGVTLTLNRLVAYLEERGTEVMVVSPTSSRPEIQHAGELVPAPSIPVPGRTEYRIGTIIPPSVRRKIAQFRPEIIHIATPDLLGRWTMGYGRRHGIPIVSTYHTDFSSYLSYYGLTRLQGLLHSYLRYFYRRCDVICVPSRSMVDELSRRGVDGRMRIWERGVDTDRFSPDHRSARWRRSYGIPDGVPVINFTGRLVREKNPDRLVEVTRRLRSQQIPHRLLIVGDGPARAELEEQMPDAIFTGHLDGSELATAYASSDLFLFPSTTETFGNVILEAMASGLPSVCIDATGSRNLVSHAVTGFLAADSDREAMHHYIRSLITEESLRHGMGTNARNAALGYGWERVLHRMTGYYAEASRMGERR